MKKTSLFSLIIIILFVNFVIAQTSTFKFVDKNNKNKITLKKIGGDLAVIEKLENTDYCFTKCHAIWNVTIKNNREIFLNLIEFKNKKGKNKEINYKFEVLSGYSEQKIPIYDKICEEINDFNNSLRCRQEIVGYDTRKLPIWEQFNPKKALPKGNYLIKLTGYKQWNEDIDWQPTIFGAKITEWAWWQGTQPVGYWKMNEGSGDALDSSGEGSDNFTLLNDGVLYQAGKLNNAAYNFDNNKELYNASFKALGTSDFTIAFWLKAENIDRSLGDYLISSQDTGNGIFYIRTIADDSLWFRIFDTAGVLTPYVQVLNSSWEDNLWHRFVFIRDGTNMSVFLDGSWINGTTITSGINIDDVGLTIGNSLAGSGAGGFENADIDDVQIYNVSWTADDVITDWNSGAGREADDLSGIPFDSLNILLPLNISYNASETIEFNISTDEILDTCLFSFDNFLTNYSMEIDASLSGANYTNFTMTQGQKTAKFWCNDSYGNVNGTESVTFFLDSKAPNITIFSPSDGNSKNIKINISVYDLSGTDYCYFNITRGASLEVSNTEIPNCQNTTATLSGYADYMIYVFANDTFNHINWTNKSFTISELSVSGGGGGGGAVVTQILETLLPEQGEGLTCIPLYDSLKNKWEIIQKDKSWSSVKEFLLALYDSLVCGSASSIIKI